jgi:hypothetical protein
MGGAKRYPSPRLVFLLPLTERPIEIGNIARPIFRIDFEFHHTMKRRIRPIPDPRHKPMLDRIDVSVIDVTREIVRVANGVFPITPLPDAALGFGGTTV